MQCPGNVALYTINDTNHSEGVAGEHVYALQDIDTVFLSIPELVQHIPWITFKILFCFYLQLQHMAGSLIADYLGATGLSEEIVKIRMTHAKFHKLWSNLLAILNEELVPLTTIVDVRLKTHLAPYNCNFYQSNRHQS